MLDLLLLRRPSFATIAVEALGLSASVVAATTYIVLYFVNTLGLTPFQTGLRFLPLTGGSFLAAPVAARLSQRVPPRVLVPAGSALIAVGVWLMTGLDGASDWTHLLPGSLAAGLGLAPPRPSCPRLRSRPSSRSEPAWPPGPPTRSGRSALSQVSPAWGLFAHSSAQDVQAPAGRARHTP